LKLIKEIVLIEHIIKSINEVIIKLPFIFLIIV
jgi:hypothetical protein